MPKNTNSNLYSRYRYVIQFRRKDPGLCKQCFPSEEKWSQEVFNFNIHTKEGTRRGVCFSPEKRNPMSAYQDDQKPIKVHKFRISSTNDIMFDQKTIISQQSLIQTMHSSQIWYHWIHSQLYHQSTKPCQNN